MSRKFLTPIDLSKNELQNARIQNLASAPSSPVVGQIYYDTSLNGLYIYNGTAWALAGGISAGTLSARPLASAVAAGSFYYTTDTHVIYYSDASTWQQVGIGTNTTDTLYNKTLSSPTILGPMYVQSGGGAGGTNNTITANNSTGVLTINSGYGVEIDATGNINFGPSGTATVNSDVITTNTASQTLTNKTLGSGTSLTANLNANSNKITNLATPTASTDAANKSYVDSVAQGLSILSSAEYFSAGTIAGTYAAGSAGVDGGTGVGATITYSATGATTIDSGPDNLNVGDRIVVAGGTAALSGANSIANGLYTVTTAGTSGVATVLTRSTDYDNHLNGQVVSGTFVYIALGATYGGTGWVQKLQGTATNVGDGIKVGTDPIQWAQFSGVGTYTASNGVTLSGNNFTFTPLSTGGLTTGASGASVLLPTNSGLGTTSSGLAVGAGTGITVSGGTVSLTNTSLTVNGSTVALGGSTTITANTTNALTLGTGLTGTSFNGSAAVTAAIDTSVVVRKYSTTLATSATSYTVTHNLGTLDVQVTLYDASTGVEYFADVTHATTNTITVAFSTAPSANQIRVVVFG